MKNVKWLTLLLCGFITACSQNKYENYSNEGKIIIEGLVHNKNLDMQVVSISFTGIDYKNEFYTEIVDSTGKFRFEINIPHPQVVFVRSLNGITHLYVSPGDSLSLTTDPDFIINGTQIATNIIGNNPMTSKNIQDYLQARRIEDFNPVCENKTAGQYLNEINKRISLEDSILKIFVKENDPTQEFRKWAKYDILYHNANYLMDLKFYNSINKVLIEEDIFNKNVFPVNKDDAVITLNYYTHLWNYAMDKYFEKDTTITNLIKEHKQSEAYTIFLQNIARHEKKGVSRDLMVYSLAIDLIDKNREEFLKLYPVTEKLLTNEFLIIKLRNRKQQTEEQTNFSISEFDDDKKLENEIIGDFFSGLISKHPDKVLFLDIWATWCGPCRNEFLYSKNLHEYYENKPVEFINLCLSSDRSEWLKAINNLQITGENYYFDRSQSEMLKSKLKFKGFPTYMIINKKGEIISKSAPRPSSGKTLKTILDSLI